MKVKTIIKKIKIRILHYISDVRGFTLFEVVVAVAISSLILIMVYSSHSSITKAVYQLTGIADFYENVNLTIYRIQKDISCAYFTKDNKNVTFISESNYEPPFNGKLNFVTVDHQEFFMMDDPDKPYPESDIKEVGYFLKPDNQTQNLNFLIRREESHYDDEPETGGEYDIILENVIDIKFEFRKGNDWTNSWDSRETKRFPQIVKTILKIKNYNNEDEIFEFITKINNPMFHIINKFKNNYRKRQTLLIENGLFKYISNSSGYVLIIVLLVITLLVTMSTEFLMVAQTNINYIRKFSERLKAGMIAKAGVSLSTIILKADKLGLTQSFLGKQGVSKDIDCYKDIWAINFPELPLEDGTLKIEIEDENSKINLSVVANEVVDSTPYYGILQRFLLNMQLSMDIADTIKDWVDVDDSTSPYGAESSDYYQNLEIPYKAKNAAMDSIDELLMVKDITPAIFYGLEKVGYEPEENFVKDNKGDVDLDLSKLSEISPEEMLDQFKEEKNLSGFNIGKEKSRKLSDYLRVNGDRSDFTNELNKININTASYRVLSALTGNMSDDIVTEIIRHRLLQPYKNVDEIKDLIEDENVLKNILTVKSYLFKITATGTINQTKVRISGIYYRDRNRFLYWSEE